MNIMDIEKLIKNLDCWLGTNDNSINTVVNKFDLSKKEDVDTLINAVSNLKKINDSFDSGLMKLITGYDQTDLNVALDKFVDIVKDQHNKIVKEKQLERKVIDKTEIVKPSTKVNMKMKNQIKDLVEEYINAIIMPSVDMTENQCESIADGLFEFACWILNK